MKDELRDKFIQSNKDDYENFCDEKGLVYDREDNKISYLKHKINEFNEMIRMVEHPKYRYFPCSSCPDNLGFVHELLVTRNKNTNNEIDIYFCKNCLRIKTKFRKGVKLND